MWIIAGYYVNVIVSATLFLYFVCLCAHFLKPQIAYTIQSFIFILKNKEQYGLTSIKTILVNIEGSYLVSVKGEWLACYNKYLRTLEINNTF
jgi:hypothetical protein